MRGVNRVTLIGNLGRDPDLQYIEGNIPVVKFPLATTEAYKDKSGQMMSQTEWHNVVLWRGLAEIAHKFLHKGSFVYIEGRLRTRSWEDRDQVRRFSTEIVADNMVMLDRKKDSQEQEASNHAAAGGGYQQNPMAAPKSENMPATDAGGETDGLPF